MFLCRDCLKEYDVDFDFITSRSINTCEDCGKRSICVDYKGYKNNSNIIETLTHISSFKRCIKCNYVIDKRMYSDNFMEKIND